MAINHGRRLDRLEETHRPKAEYRRGHRVIGHDDREIEREKQKLIASGVAKPGDFFIARLIISP
ncbi:MAG TPA: hypothetical protein VNX23_30410 [Bradyrhizobium sp.]|jgi:hypothetical protein|uniref:hypothetical protein n=1 Tax=Bradyrhizobium sp. TaxID=376 RepID=UPI002BAA4A2A|nr:hypothetical protein [Bradyrhizobium sp.]HXB81681.1 hypothetical protein [Bradyrhizobium sp.]